MLRRTEYMHVWNTVGTNGTRVALPHKKALLSMPLAVARRGDHGLCAGAAWVGVGALTTRGGDVPFPATTAPEPTISAKRRSAMTWLAASEVWYASQNTKSLRLGQSCAVGRHSPPTDVSTSQHDVFDVLNPALRKHGRRRLLLTAAAVIEQGMPWSRERVACYNYRVSVGGR